MKTVKIYMVRKPSDIDEVMELCRRYALQAEEVVAKMATTKTTAK